MWNCDVFPLSPFFIGTYVILGCEECMTSYEIECPTHRLTLFPDKVVLSRAWASLPQMLQIFRLEDASSQYGGGKFDFISKFVLIFRYSETNIYSVYLYMVSSSGSF